MTQQSGSNKTRTRFIPKELPLKTTELEILTKDVPFIPIWKTQPLSLTKSEQMLALHILRVFRNRLHNLHRPEAKHREDLEKYRCSESMNIHLDTNESLLVWKAIHEYSVFRHGEVTSGTTELMNKVHQYLAQKNI